MFHLKSCLITLADLSEPAIFCFIIQLLHSFYLLGYLLSLAEIIRKVIPKCNLLQPWAYQYIWIWKRSEHCKKPCLLPWSSLKWSKDSPSGAQCKHTTSVAYRYLKLVFFIIFGFHFREHLYFEDLIILILNYQRFTVLYWNQWVLLKIKIINFQLCKHDAFLPLFLKHKMKPSFRKWI